MQKLSEIIIENVTYKNDAIRILINRYDKLMERQEEILILLSYIARNDSSSYIPQKIQSIIDIGKDE